MIYKEQYTRIILSFSLILLNFSVVAQYNNSLEVNIKNIELIEGDLYLTLTADSSLFPMGEVAEKYRKELKVTDSQMTTVFSDLPDGDYAMAIFQDLNNNQELDKKKFGIPAEPFAFSNGALRKFSPPYFEQAKFEISGGQAHQQELKLIYKKPKKKDQN